MNELRFGNLKLLKFIGRIDKGQGCIRKELNLVQWYDNPSQYDLRIWDMTNEPNPGKGISFSYSELEALLALLMDVVAEHNGKHNPQVMAAKAFVSRGSLPKPMKPQAQPTTKKRKTPPPPKKKPVVSQTYLPKRVIAPDVNTLEPPTTVGKDELQMNAASLKLSRPIYTPRNPLICNYPSCKERVYRDGFCKDHFSHERYTSK